MTLKPLSQGASEFISAARQSGLSRSETIRAAAARGIDITVRDYQKAIHGGLTPEKLAQQSRDTRSSAISGDVQNIRDSWRRNAEKQGVDIRIRGNTDYQNFKRELQDLEKSRESLYNSLGKRQGRNEYKEQHLNIYLKYGLITQGQYDKYMGA